jgi:glycosyltransferase involved in cell wall biosynthesis
MLKQKNALEVLYIFNYLSWSDIIVKSKDMYSDLNIKDAHIIPNGINMDRFKPINQDLAQKKLNWNKNKKHILFASDPNRLEKNFRLAKEAFDILDNQNIELHFLKDIENEKISYYYNASDVVLLTSLWEGSPNVIKEAMSCNRPIVSTDVGDVKIIIQDTKGCYISANTPQEVSKCIQKALTFNITKGREKVDFLDEKMVAKQIIKIYKTLIK